MLEVIFLSVLALIWIIFAVVQDLKKREVANWLNFSLIIFALGFRFFYCLFSLNIDFTFLYQGLIGLGIFFVLGNAFYYGRMFAGGDAKLMIALGAILPFSTDFFINVRIFIWFFFIFLFVGALYSLIISLVLTLRNFKNFKKEFHKQLNKKRKFLYVFMVFGLVLMGLGFIEDVMFVLGILVFLLPYFYLYVKVVDECCMVKKIKTNRLTEGDWLYEDVKVGNKVIKKSWDGVSKKEIKFLKGKNKEVLIRQGIPFTPVFLFSFLILIFFYLSGLINLFYIL
jgi:Flp pilus assembly protein protease CpaA